MTNLYVHIKTLVNLREDSPLLKGDMLAHLPCLHEAFLVVEDGIISDYGLMTEPRAQRYAGDSKAISLQGRMVLPAWCDAHTHLVFAGSREEEFVYKIRGMSYAEIAARGGGILNSARLLEQTSEDELFRQAWQRLEEIRRQGTGAVEIKSGYGLTIEGELKMLRVIRRLKERSGLPIRATFLGAHAYPERFRDNHQGYIDQIRFEMLPVIARDQLADYADVFVEDGFFSLEEAETICRSAMDHGLRIRLHANQLSNMGAVELGVRLGAVSVDHLEQMDAQSIAALASSSTIGTLLPTAAFFLRMPFQPAREIIEAGAAVALASDYNPGSSPSGNMNLVVAMACIGMKMLPEEAVNAATLNGAHAMNLASELGSISRGKRALLNVTHQIPSLSFLPYAFGSTCLEPLE